MKDYSLQKYSSIIYLEEFESTEIKLIPYQEAGLYRFQNGSKEKISDRDRGYQMVELEQMRRRGIVEIYLQEHQEHGFCEIGPEDRKFEVILESKDGAISDGIMAAARTVLSNIVEMDSQARESGSESNENYDEELAYIVVNEREVELHYFANTVNTEWGAFFKMKEDGNWTYEGLG